MRELYKEQPFNLFGGYITLPFRPLYNNLLFNRIQTTSHSDALLRNFIVVMVSLNTVTYT